MRDENPTAHERRHMPRVETQFLVKFRPLGAARGKWNMTPLKNLSTTGVRFTAAYACTPGTALELQLLLPTIAMPVHVVGHVTWTRPSSVPRFMDCGVEFTDVLPTQREGIEKLVTLYRSRKRTAR